MTNDKPATRKDIDDVLKVLTGFMQQSSDSFTAINERFTAIDERFTAIDKRFNSVDIQLFSMNSRLDSLEKRIIELEASHQRLLNTLDKFYNRINNSETEQAARDSQFARLLEWAKKVSKKTGIPLEDF